MNPLKDIVEPALAMMNPKFGSKDAKRLLIAIGYVESDFRYEEQIGGPAHGYWMFEKGGGVKGVLTHTATKDLARRVCKHFGVQPTPEAVYRAIAADDKTDLLECILARLLLYTDPKPLPTDEDGGWVYYLRNWRPGKPGHDRWARAWRLANEAVP